jgi:hypothetical protein
MRKQPIAVLLTSILALSSAQAADAVRWEDLPKKIGHSKSEHIDREFTVVTRDGNTRKGHGIILDPKGVQFSDGSTAIPREEVAEIRIHHHERMSEAAEAPTAAVFSKLDEGWIFTPLFLLVIPAMCGVYAATAPPAIVVEGFRRMLPDKVVKVEP